MERRRSWVLGLGGPALLIFMATCGETGGANRRSAATVWERTEVVYFHPGVSPGPVLTTNADCTLREERRYEPFGQAIDANVGGTIVVVDYRREPQNGLGKLSDAATGWSYHGARWMQPQTARWTAPDPAVREPSAHIGTPWNLNPYPYVGQNPLLFWDPDGWEKAIFFVGIPTRGPVPLRRDGVVVGQWNYDQATYVEAVRRRVAARIGEDVADVTAVPITSDEDYARKAAEVKDPEQYTKGGYVGHGRENTPFINPADDPRTRQDRDLSSREWVDGMERFTKMKQLRFYGCETHQSGFAPKVKRLMPEVEVQSARGAVNINIRPDGHGGIDVDFGGTMRPEPTPSPEGTPAEMDTDVTGGGEL
jgi:RHS repeat-associated protein